jgi:hypothetical protein
MARRGHAFGCRPLADRFACEVEEREGGTAWMFQAITPFSLSRTSARTHSPPMAVFDP